MDSLIVLKKPLKRKPQLVAPVLTQRSSKRDSRSSKATRTPSRRRASPDVIDKTPKVDFVKLYEECLLYGKLNARRKVLHRSLHYNTPIRQISDESVLPCYDLDKMMDKYMYYDDGDVTPIHRYLFAGKTPYVDLMAELDYGQSIVKF